MKLDDVEFSAIMATLLEEGDEEEVAYLLMDAIEETDLSPEDKARIAAEVAVWLMP